MPFSIMALPLPEPCSPGEVIGQIHPPPGSGEGFIRVPQQQVGSHKVVPGEADLRDSKEGED
jgi:hypothetical protein